LCPARINSVVIWSKIFGKTMLQDIDKWVVLYVNWRRCIDKIEQLKDR